MKKDYPTQLHQLTAICILLVFAATSSIAQVPGSFSYQAALRNPLGGLLSNTTASIQVVILQGSADGTQVYTETHSVTTNAFGLVNLEVGSVDPTSFASIDWSGGPYFIKILVNGSEMGASELLSVPYALHAGTVDTEKQQLSLLEKELSISGGNAVMLPEEDQQLSVSGEQMSISGGNTVDLPTTYSDLTITNTLTTTGTGLFTVGDNGLDIREIRILTGSTTTNNTVSISLPSGYRWNNTRVLSVEIHDKITDPLSLYWDIDLYGLGYSGTNGTVGYRIKDSHTTIGAPYIYTLYLQYPDECKEMTFRVVLMKVVQ